jgi:V/A-type H+-transporting ATPase subunit E
MALADIKQHIKDKAAEEVQAIEAQSQADLARLGDEWKVRLQEERDRLTKQIDRAAEAALAQAKYRIKEKAKTQLLNAKQARLDEVFDKALEKLQALPDPEYLALLKSLLTHVKDESGEIFGSPERLAVLEQAAQEVGCQAPVAADSSLKAAGFVFRSGAADRDFRFPTIMDRLREDIVIEVNQKLLSK